eukprot:14527225-Alexandrium_andersonii.AAC.1
MAEAGDELAEDVQHGRIAPQQGRLDGARDVGHLVVGGPVPVPVPASGSNIWRSGAFSCTAICSHVSSTATRGHQRLVPEA